MWGSRSGAGIPCILSLRSPFTFPCATFNTGRDTEAVVAMVICGTLDRGYHMACIAIALWSRSMGEQCTEMHKCIARGRIGSDLKSDLSHLSSPLQPDLIRAGQLCSGLLFLSSSLQSEIQVEIQIHNCHIYQLDFVTGLIRVRLYPGCFISILFLSYLHCKEQR